MMGLMDNAFVFVEIVLINLLLSGDNAVVIAMAGRRLPPDKRRQAVLWGAAAAVVLRCALTVGAVALLSIPYLQIAGAVLLFIIAVQLIGEHGAGAKRTAAASTLVGAIWTIVVADFVMSLDNVLAVAAVADGDIVMLIIGITMSIPIIIWGSSFIMRLLDSFPSIIYVGGALLGYAASEMLLKDPGFHRLVPAMSPALERIVPFGTIGLLFVVSLILRNSPHKR